METECDKSSKGIRRRGVRKIALETEYIYMILEYDKVCQVLHHVILADPNFSFFR